MISRPQQAQACFGLRDLVRVPEEQNTTITSTLKPLWIQVIQRKSKIGIFVFQIYDDATTVNIVTNPVHPQHSSRKKATSWEYSLYCMMVTLG